VSGARGIAVLLAAAVLAAFAGVVAVVGAVRRRRRSRRRLRRLAGAGDASVASPHHVGPASRPAAGEMRPGVAAAAAGVAAVGAATLSWPGAGWPAAAAVGSTVLGAGLLGARHLLPRLAAPPAVDTGPLPAALDLFAACLAAGSPVPDALAETGAAAGGDVGAVLAAAATGMRQGAPARAAWAAALGPEPVPALAALGRACVRSERGGTPLQTVLTRLAGEQRAVVATRRQEAARRAGVLAVLPLGLCFLPAYLLLGVVPAVAGLAARFT